MSSKRTFFHTLMAVVVILAQVGQPLANALGVPPTAANLSLAPAYPQQRSQSPRSEWTWPQTESRQFPRNRAATGSALDCLYSYRVSSLIVSLTYHNRRPDRQTLGLLLSGLLPHSGKS